MTLSRRDLLRLALIGAAHPLLPVRGIVSQVFAAPGAAPRSYGSGFLNRLAAALDGAAAPVAFTDGLPTVMTGDVIVPNVSLKGTGRPAFDDRQMALLSGMYAGTRFEPLIAEGFDLRKTVAQQAEMMASGSMSAEMQAA